MLKYADIDHDMMLPHIKAGAEAGDEVCIYALGLLAELEEALDEIDGLESEIDILEEKFNEIYLRDD